MKQEIIKLQDTEVFRSIEEQLVDKKATLRDACKQAGTSYMDFYNNHIRNMSPEEFNELFLRAREVRGLEILDTCCEAFRKMQDTDDNSVAWKQKNIIDVGLRLAAKLNQALSDKSQSQTNIQLNNYQHDTFVLKKLEDK